MTIADDDEDERAFDENEYHRAEEEQAVPKSVDAPAELAVRAEGRVGMRAGTRAGNDRESGYQNVWRKPPQAVETFHLDIGVESTTK